MLEKFKTYFDQERSKYFFLAAFLLLVPALFHLTFSHLGFNPTDDGIVLAGARRVLEGQIPFLDFITIRTPLSFYLYAPIVIFAGRYTIWFARYFVLLEIAIISISWVLLSVKLLNLKIKSYYYFLLALIIFTITLHSFPIMPWTTLDALTFVSAGSLLLFNERRWLKYLGYFLIGLSPLFRQSFALFAIFPPLIAGDKKDLKAWLSLWTPSFLFAGFLLLSGSANDAVNQLISRSDLISFGFLIYLNIIFFLGLLLGGVLNFAWGRPQKENFYPLVAILFSIGVVLTLFVNRLGQASFAFFGFLLGILLTNLMIFKVRKGEPLFLFALLASWSAAISVGYAYPVLGAGVILGICFLYFLEKELIIRKVDFRNYLVIALALITTSAFLFARINYIYREPNAKYITRSLSLVFPGAGHIFTNSYTYAFLYDLDLLIKENPENNFVILPDFEAYWAASPKKNPLPADWTFDGELPNKKLVERVEKSLEENRGKQLIFVEKYDVGAISIGKSEIAKSEVADYVKEHFSKIKETEYFYIYR
jgi:hypothetical protein